MYPYELIAGSGIDLYVLFIVVGVAMAFVTLRVLADKTGMNAKAFNFTLLSGACAIVLGWLAAMLVQAIYNYVASGVFEFRGQTFLGGLIGGAAVFLGVYFGIGKFVFKERENVKAFPLLLTIAMPCIVVAHAFGRLGCLMDGCCYGGVTDEWYGIMMYSGGAWAKRVPTQLMESLFLFALFAALIFLILKKKFRNTLSVYLIAYGAWRFMIEFVRADSERGSIGSDLLYPSQLISIFLVLGGVAFIFLAKFVYPVGENK